MQSNNFGLVGAAGYIAPRHLKAIHATGNRLVAAADPNDSVGVLDKYFMDVRFFPEIERFDRFLEKSRRKPYRERIHYLSICTPNYLHDAHIRMALRVEADAICEKPIVINPWNLDALEELEKERAHRVWTVLQLRVHPSLIKLKQNIERETVDKKYDVLLTYITSRGPWYHVSWKGSESHSGGLATNIGIHFFDLLIWLFGEVQKNEVHCKEKHRYSGFLELKHANVRWLLSVDRADLPENIRSSSVSTFRSITVNGEEIEFTRGFTDLHTRLYELTLAGKGFGISDARPSVELVYDIRHKEITRNPDYIHPHLIGGKL